MTIPVLTFSDLKEILSNNGYIVEDPQPQDFFSEHNRIMVKKDDYAFPLQYREKYFYLQVYHLFTNLGIEVPEDHLTCYKQHMEHAKNKISKEK